jgi:hypothetical protein
LSWLARLGKTPLQALRGPADPRAGSSRAGPIEGDRLTEARAAGLDAESLLKARGESIARPFLAVHQVNRRTIPERPVPVQKARLAGVRG